MDALTKDFQYYLDNQDELVKKYNGKTLVIVAEKVVGAYNSNKEALTEAVKKYELGTFLIQECSPGEGAYTQTFQSRVTFINTKV